MHKPKIKGLLFFINSYLCFTQHRNKMKISVENLGTIKKGEISLDKDLTIFTGENNSGKSYMSYLCYGILDFIPMKNNNLIDNFSQLITNLDLSVKLSNGIKIDLKKIINLYCEWVCSSISVVSKDVIPAIFGQQMPSATFNIKNAEIIYWNICYKYFKDIEDAEITAYTKKYDVTIKDNFVIITTDNYDILDTSKVLARLVVEGMSNLQKYFIPAERTAINMFYNDIVNQKSSEAEDLSIIKDTNEIRNKLEDLRKEGKMLPYATLPLMRYIKFAHDFRKHITNPPTEFADLATELENLLGGGVGVSGFGDLQFQPTKETNQIPLYLSSSLVKSWSGVVIYLRHLAQKGDILEVIKVNYVANFGFLE